MLKELEINNGQLSPFFDSNIFIYNVSIDKDTNYLDLFTQAEDGYSVNIIGNEDLKDGQNTVFIEVSNDYELNTYTLNVMKETTVTKAIYTPLEPLEVQKELPLYVAPLISIICFILILFLYTILFHKKRNI